jgi:pimeloyl-ACP methyl ester carboxylesterase
MNDVIGKLTPGKVLSYVSYLHEKPFSYHWTIYTGPAEYSDLPHIAAYRFVFLAESFPASIGLGGPPVRIRAELYSDARLYPLRYRVETKSSVNTLIAIENQVLIILPDGTTQTVEVTSFRSVLGENLGQLALALKFAENELDDSFTGQFFSLGGISLFDYSLSPLQKPDAAASSGRWFRSSFMEDLLIDDDGWLERHELVSEGMVSIREETPVPDWVNEPLYENPLQYTKPENASFAVREVQVPGPTVPIGTTITIPRGPGPHPVAIFLGGSGAHDRHGIAGDVDLGSHEIVDFLSENGWLCARFDSRGAGSTGIGSDLLEFGVEEIVNDARAVMKYVMALDEARSTSVALVGHSQGGVIAMELAVGEESVQSIVLLATPGRALDEVLRDQILVRAEWLKLGSEQIETQIAEFEEFLRVIKSGSPWTRENVPQRFFVLKRLRKWYLDHLNRNPSQLITRLKCPVLICQGRKDFQVSAEKDARALYQAASDAGLRVEMEIFDDLDHLFKQVEGDSHISQYYDPHRKVADVLKQRILDFINSHRQ